MKYVVVIAVLLFSIASCNVTNDTCDNLKGYITHGVIEITGVESTSVLKRIPETGAAQAVDQFNGAEFANLEIELDLAWIEEQHRFRATNTIIQSFFAGFISSAYACSLGDYYEEYDPLVTSIEIYSDSDLNADLVAGSDLSNVFTASAVTENDATLFEASQSNTFLSARDYSLRPAYKNGSLASVPETPRTHVFTISVNLADGRAYEVRTNEVLLSGI